ncbi:MAG TPA: glycosyltransferase family 2 protein [Candidatus Hydrogenedentes bacterium]|nr:glycosyltransferase family 2 protein [Candidatus Hydrogenedentota bacterium]
MSEAMTGPTVSIIIPTWNRCDLVAECLRSLEKQTFRDVEIIVVDDGSTDDTVEVLHWDFPQAKVIQRSKNQGFAVAVNAGIRQARGEWIFLLNNDVTLGPRCLEHLLASASQTQADMIAPLILWKDSPETIYSAGDAIRTNARPESIGFRSPCEGFVFPQTIFGVSAAAGLYHSRIFKTVGLLDETFIAYFEDSDLCFRARLAGFTAALAPEAIAYHVGSASISGKTWWRSAQCFRNHGLLIIKNMPLPLIIRYSPALIRERIHQARMLFSAARAEFGAAKAILIFYSTLFSFFRALPHAFWERFRIQRKRRLDVTELRSLLSVWKAT